MESYWPGRRSRRGGGSAGDPGMGGQAGGPAQVCGVVVAKHLPSTNSHHIAAARRTGAQSLKDVTPTGMFLGSGKLAAEPDRLDQIDEYKSVTRRNLIIPPGLPAAGGVERAVPQFLDLATHPLLDSRTGDQALSI